MLSPARWRRCWSVQRPWLSDGAGGLAGPWIDEMGTTHAIDGKKALIAAAGRHGGVAQPNRCQRPGVLGGTVRVLDANPPVAPPRQISADIEKQPGRLRNLRPHRLGGLVEDVPLGDGVEIQRLPGRSRDHAPDLVDSPSGGGDLLHDRIQLRRVGRRSGALSLGPELHQRLHPRAAGPTGSLLPRVIFAEYGNQVRGGGNGARCAVQPAQLAVRIEGAEDLPQPFDLFENDVFGSGSCRRIVCKNPAVESGADHVVVMEREFAVESVVARWRLCRDERRLGGSRGQSRQSGWSNSRLDIRCMGPYSGIPYALNDENGRSTAGLSPVISRGRKKETPSPAPRMARSRTFRTGEWRGVACCCRVNARLNRGYKTSKAAARKPERFLAADAENQVVRWLGG